MTVFFGILALSVLGGLWIDSWLRLPQITAWWRFVLAAVVFIPGIIATGSSVTRFFMSGGTPVPLAPPPKLITTGLYAHVRNPMGIGLFLVLESIGLFLGSPSVIVFFAPLPVLLYALFIVTVEEPELEIRFGEPYRDYKSKVPRFVPRLRQ